MYETAANELMYINLNHFASCKEQQCCNTIRMHGKQNITFYHVAHVLSSDCPQKHPFAAFWTCRSTRTRMRMSNRRTVLFAQKQNNRCGAKEKETSRHASQTLYQYKHLYHNSVAETHRDLCRRQHLNKYTNSSLLYRKTNRKRSEGHSGLQLTAPRGIKYSLTIIQDIKKKKVQQHFSWAACSQLLALLNQSESRDEKGRLGEEERGEAAWPLHINTEDRMTERRSSMVHFTPWSADWIYRTRTRTQSKSHTHTHTTGTNTRQQQPHLRQTEGNCNWYQTPIKLFLKLLSYSSEQHKVLHSP